MKPTNLIQERRILTSNVGHIHVQSFQTKDKWMDRQYAHTFSGRCLDDSVNHSVVCKSFIPDALSSTSRCLKALVSEGLAIYASSCP